MTAVRLGTLRKYLDFKLTQNKRLQAFVDRHVPAYRQGMLPHPFLLVDPGLSSQFGGYADGSIQIRVASWCLADKVEALAMLRHEYAHCVVAYAQLPGSSHGRGFKTALRVIAPKTWKHDLHWHPTTAIMKARVKKYGGRA